MVLHMSKIRLVSLALALATLGLANLPASTTLMALDEVRPGMTGVGRTVFDGDRREEFKVHILGVLRNVVGPQRHLILARLEGGPLERTGVMQGMSGSPVYVDGRLIGAVSYSIGAFSKEPIAGITPIAEMTETAALAARRPAIARQDLELPLTREGLAAALRKAFQRLRPFAERPGDVDALGLPAADAGRIGALLRPIATPIVMGGFGDAAASLVGGAFSDAGFLPINAGTWHEAARETTPKGSYHLEPGDAVGVGLITGDLEFGGDGHGDPRRRRPRLRLRPPVLQPRTDSVSDDARARVLAPSEPDELVQDHRHGRDHRHVRAGSRDDNRRTPRRRTGDDPDPAVARFGAWHPQDLLVQRRQRSALHAAPDLRHRVQHAGLVRTAVWSRDVHDQRQGEGQGAHRRRLREPLHGRHVVVGSGNLHRRTHHDAAVERPREDRDRRPRHHRRFRRGAAQRDARTGVARRCAAAGRTNVDAQGADAVVSRRREGPVAPNRDPAARVRIADAARLGWRVSDPVGAAGGAPAHAGPERRSDDSHVQQQPEEQPAVRASRQRRARRHRRGRIAAGAAAERPRGARSRPQRR